MTLVLILSAGGLWWYYPIYMNQILINDVITRLGTEVQKRLSPWFDKADVSYPPPQRLALLGFKAERQLEVWAEKAGKWVSIRTYPILTASGVAGPKLREGDHQVPEGIYRLTFLNPKSRFHLSMQIDYPNVFDQQQAAAEERRNLGGEIFIHGKTSSVGCLAMGDEAIEELFVLVAIIGLEKVTVILAPQKKMDKIEENQLMRPWVPELYASIREALTNFE
jgi:murein L,D-transpeptidase YafK